jgi:hypothetical protein
MLLRIPAIVALTVAATAALPGGVKVGDSVQYQFRESPLNGGGLKSLQDLRGTPILIEFWGTH